MEFIKDDTYKYANNYFRVGDDVKAARLGENYEEPCFRLIDSPRFPLWGGKYGKQIGRVVDCKIENNRQVVDVIWDFYNTGSSDARAFVFSCNLDNSCNLDKINPQNVKTYIKKGEEKMKEKVQQIANDLCDQIKPYKKYIGLVAVALVIDHFFLGNQFTDRLRKLANAFVGKVLATLDKLTERLLGEKDEEETK